MNLRKFRRERGATLVFVALFMTFSVAMAAVVVDLNTARVAVRTNQNGTDAAALAGAADLPATGANDAASSTARSTAADYLRRNLDVALTTDASCSATTRLCLASTSYTAIIDSPYTLTGDSTPSYRLIRVQACKQVKLAFGAAVGQSSLHPCQSSVATLDLNSTSYVPGAIYALDSGPTCLAWETGGNGKAHGKNGSIVDNSSCAGSAFFTHDTINVKADSGSCICVVGGWSIGGTVSPTPPTKLAAPLPDPYAGVAIPNITSAGSYNAVTKTYSPGRFTSLVTISMTGATITFAPGIYQFEAGLKIEGASGRVVADNVLWYFKSGAVSIGSGPYDIRMSSLSTAQDPTNQYQGLVLLQATSNTSEFNFGDNVHAGVQSNVTDCVVTATSGFAGGVYLPGAKLHVRGNGSTFCTEKYPVAASRVLVEETSLLQGEALNGGSPIVVNAGSGSVALVR